MHSVPMKLAMGIRQGMLAALLYPHVVSPNAKRNFPRSAKGLRAAAESTFNPDVSRAVPASRHPLFIVPPQFGFTY